MLNENYMFPSFHILFPMFQRSSLLSHIPGKGFPTANDTQEIWQLYISNVVTLTEFTTTIEILDFIRFI